MPIVSEITGDLIAMAKSGEAKYIAHGCNCFMTMGAGIAKQIAEEFPIALEVDRGVGHKGDKGKLGDFTVAYDQDHDLTIFNLYTQYRPGPEKEDDLHRNIATAFEELDFYMNTILFKTDAPRKPIHIPLIGCGIAGGNWEKIRELIDENTPNLDIVVVHYVNDNK